MLQITQSENLKYDYYASGNGVQITILFAERKASLELIPEYNPPLKHMIGAVHYYEARQ